MWKLFYGRSSPQMVLFTSTEDQNVPQQSLKWGGVPCCDMHRRFPCFSVFGNKIIYVCVCIYVYTVRHNYQTPEL